MEYILYIFLDFFNAAWVIFYSCFIAGFNRFPIRKRTDFYVSPFVKIQVHIYRVKVKSI